MLLKLNKGWHWLLALAVILALIAVEYLLHSFEQGRQFREQTQLLNEGNRLSMALQTEIQQAAFLASGIESYIIARQGEIEAYEIYAILATLFERGTHFRNIGIAPDNVIRWVFPIEGNEQALGFDYRSNPQQWPAVEQVMLSRQGRLTGPLTLIQGGQGLIYRSPIVIRNQYWGQMSTVIDFDSLMTEFDSRNLEQLPLAIRGMNGQDSQGEILWGEAFWGEAGLFDGPALLFDIQVPGGQWQLALAAEGAGLALGWLRLLTWLALALLIAPIYLLLKLWWQNNLLGWFEQEVDLRTHETLRSHVLLQSVLDGASSLIIIATDLEGRIQLYNKGAERILGQHPWQELHFSQLLAAEQDLPLPLALLSPCPEHCHLWQQQSSVELELLTQEGQVILVELQYHPLGAGTEQGYLLLASDIRERKRLEQMKNDFVATINHELRTPLTAIKGAVSLLQSGKLGELSSQQQRLLNIAEQNSQRLGLLINDFLDMEKLLAGKMQLQMQPVALAQAVQQSIESHQSYASKFGVTLLATPLDEQILVWADPHRLQQILANLLSNACKFSAVDQVVELSCELNAKQALLHVRDQGAGIPWEFQRKIFHKFMQAESGNERSKEGTGLGLAISKELSERMQAELSFVSTPGQGSCFSLALLRVSEQKGHTTKPAVGKDHEPD